MRRAGLKILNLIVNPPLALSRISQCAAIPGRTTVPTDIRCTIATKLQLKKEVEFAETGILLCLALCLLNVLLILESPAFAAAVICTAG